MKSLNAKRIAAVVTGAALLGIGLAFGATATGITIGNVPIITASGQPVVQVVIGSQAKPSDGVAAANLAGAIGNLAYTWSTVIPTVNTTQAMSVLKVAVSGGGGAGSISNAQVWLNESGAGATAGSFAFTALIGSVLNGAVLLNAPQNTKILQGVAGTQYAYQELGSLTISPIASPYTSSGPSTSTSVTGSYNGGGTAFSGFRVTSGLLAWDNILLIGNAQFPGLKSNAGNTGESEFLWVSGFPVYDQANGVNNFQLINTGGAYQASFSHPIQNTLGTGAAQINVPITLLGQNWTILTENSVSVGTVGSSNTVNGGKVQLAASLVPLQTVYVGKNITTTPVPGQTWTVVLQDLGQPNSNGVSPASIAIYLNGALTNTSSITPGTTTKFNVTGKTLFVNVNQTFAGLYAYQKWAKEQVYSNVFNITDGQQWNKTTNPGWTARILWTNTTVSSGGAPRALQSIIAYNATPTSLSPGQSFVFIQSPQAFKLSFLGDTLGASGFDTVTATSASTGSINYQNPGSTSATPFPGNSISNVTEPGQELIVSSSIPSAFSYSGQSTSTVTYLLTPFALNENANALLAIHSPDNVAYSTNVIVLDTNPGSSTTTNWINSQQQLTVTVSGYPTNTATSIQTQSVTFSANGIPAASSTQALGVNLWNVIGIQVNRALPGGPNNVVVSVNAVNTATGNQINLATLKSTGPGVVYPVSNLGYAYALSQSAATSVIYNQQNGQPTATWVLTQNTVPTGNPAQYFTYAINEIAVPTNTAAIDTLSFGLENLTSGIQGVGSGTAFNVNYSVTGTNRNVTYQNSTSAGTGTKVLAGQNFRTERGSKVATIGASVDTFSIAKLADSLQFAVAPATTTVSGKAYKLFGPYGVGQATNIPNVSIGSVTANAVLSGGSYTITGISNITANPLTVRTLVSLKNITQSTATQPLVVLDANANQQSNLILIGSGFVNTLSSQLQKAYNITMSPTTQINQAYGTNRILIAGYYANQTTAATNAFIQQLYAQAK